MKKLIAIMAIIATTLFVTACGNNDDFDFTGFNNPDAVVTPTPPQNNEQSGARPVEPGVTEQPPNMHEPEAPDELEVDNPADGGSNEISEPLEDDEERLERILFEFAELYDMDFEVEELDTGVSYMLETENSLLFVDVLLSGGIGNAMYRVWFEDEEYMIDDTIWALVSFVEVFTNEMLDDEQVMLLEEAMIASIGLAPERPRDATQVNLNGRDFVIMQTGDTFTILV